MKELADMSVEELWQLFPIYLTKPNPDWAAWYEEEAESLKERLEKENLLRMSHIGSTAIHGIWAKPIIDILLEVPKKQPLHVLKEVLTNSGYICMSEEPERISFNKGYTPQGFAERVFHLHVRHEGDHAELYFRDYLNRYPEVAKEYENIKLSLWQQFEHNRDAYTDSKTDFVTYYSKQAKREFGGRYD